MPNYITHGLVHKKEWVNKQAVKILREKTDLKLACSGGYRWSAVWRPCGVMLHTALQNKSVVCSGSHVTNSTVMKVHESDNWGGITVTHVQRALAHTYLWSVVTQFNNHHIVCPIVIIKIIIMIIDYDNVFFWFGLLYLLIFFYFFCTAHCALRLAGKLLQ